MFAPLELDFFLPAMPHPCSLPRANYTAWLQPLDVYQTLRAVPDYRGRMHFMVLILVFLLCAVVWGFFHANPRGVPHARLLAVNVAILALGVAAAAASGYLLYGDALVKRPDERAMAAYLAI